MLLLFESDMFSRILIAVLFMSRNLMIYLLFFKSILVLENKGSDYLVVDEASGQVCISRYIFVLDM